MSKHDIIRLWKNEDGEWDRQMPENPVGQELAEEDLLKVTGAAGSFGDSLSTGLICETYGSKCTRVPACICC